MPEPETVAGAEVTPQAVEPVVETPPVETDVSHETPPETPDDGEPGGKGPLEVARRKEYERRVAAEARAAALEEQLKAAREVPAAKETKVFSMAEVRQAVRDGRISESDGDTYIQETIIPHQIKQTLEAEKRQQAEQEPLARALADVEAYKAEIPELTDTRSEPFRKVATEYQRLIRERGMSPNYVTQALAVETTLGKLADIKKRSEVDRNTRLGLTPPPTDRGAGGAGAVVSGKIDLTKAPQTMVTSWDREGVDQVTRERRYKIYLDLKARQSVR